MKRHTRAIAAAALSATLGCATRLTVRELRMPLDEEDPGGIPVNLRAQYMVTIDARPLLRADAGRPESVGWVTDAKAELVNVDEERMMAVNICRQPFASGTLDLTLDPQQRVKRIELTGTPGAARAVTAVKEVLSARKEIQDEKSAKKK